MARKEYLSVFNTKIDEVRNWFNGYMDELAYRFYCDSPKKFEKDPVYGAKCAKNNDLIADEINKILESLEKIQILQNEL